MAQGGESAGTDYKSDTRKDRQLKFVLLGDGTTGKTSIATRIAQNNFTKTYDQTLGVDFFLRRLELPGDVQVAIQVWDIGGQTVGGRMLDNYIYGAHAILFVYDITNYSSFENVDDWLREATRICSKTDKQFPHMALVANKIDMEHMRTVRIQRHTTFAQKHNMSSHSISAKTDDMLYQCFLKIAAAVLKIRLTSSDLDITQKVISADVVPHETPKLLPSVTKTKPQRTTKSMFCIIQ